MSDLPWYLREDSDPACQCSVCERKSWDLGMVAQRCGMPQPNGDRCDGRMQPVSPVPWEGEK